MKLKSIACLEKRSRRKSLSSWLDKVFLDIPPKAQSKEKNNKLDFVKFNIFLAKNIVKGVKK